MSEQAAQLFRNYSWPGNVRQLENVVKRLGLTARGVEISLTEVEQALSNQPAMNLNLQKGSTDRLSADVERHLRRYFDLHGNILPPPGLHARILREVEGPLIEIALEANGGNQAKCADDRDHLIRNQHYAIHESVAFQPNPDSHKTPSYEATTASHAGGHCPVHARAVTRKSAEAWRHCFH